MKKSDLYMNGWNWAKEEFKKGVPLSVLEDYADNSFDFNDFDRGALDAIHELYNQTSTNKS